MSECPTPDKSTFASERAAKRALRGIKHPHGQMQAYRCGGHWHLGHGHRSHNELGRRMSR